MHSPERLRAAMARRAVMRVGSAPPPPRRTARSRAWARDRGQSVVEFALLLPVFLLILVVAVDFGRLFFTWVQIHNAAREAAAVGSYSPTDTAGMSSRVAAEKNAQGQKGENAVTVSSTCANPAGTTITCASAPGGTGAGNTITVTVSEHFSFLTPLINQTVGSNLQISASATSTVLGYAAGTGAGSPGSCSLPVASFTWTITSGRTIFANPSASTPNSGLCNISGYNWTWGDGVVEPGTATGNSHTFSADGTYVVQLEVTNQAGPAVQQQTVIISTATAPPSCAKPTANFTWTKSGKTYTYRDASTVADAVNCPITDWLWTFTDLGGLQSNAQNPAAVTYGNNSSHSVTLRVTNLGGATTITLST
jgi:Flp pilus assembly protein TadG